MYSGKLAEELEKIRLLMKQPLKGESKTPLSKNKTPPTKKEKAGRKPCLLRAGVGGRGLSDDRTCVGWESCSIPCPRKGSW